MQKFAALLVLVVLLGAFVAAAVDILALDEEAAGVAAALLL